MTRRSTTTVFRFAVWATLLYAGLAWGQIYKWTDRHGQVHFTDNPSRIPPEYRTNATAHGTSAPPVAAAPSAPGEDAAKALDPAPPPPSQAPSAAEPRDRLGRGPEHWRGLARQWSAALQQHLAERDRLQLLYNYTRTLADRTRDVWDRGRLEAEVERLEKALADVHQQIKEAQTMLQTTLPLEAVQLGANPDWLKEPPPPSR
jgi:hypothetical protein